MVANEQHTNFFHLYTSTCSTMLVFGGFLFAGRCLSLHETITPAPLDTDLAYWGLVYRAQNAARRHS